MNKKSFKPRAYLDEINTWPSLKPVKAVTANKRDNVVWKLFRDWSLHGFKYVGKSDRFVLERIFWIIIIIGCLLFSVYLIHIGIVVPLSGSPVIVSFKPSDISVDRIPFPGITICNVNKVKLSAKERLRKAYYKRLKCPPNTNATSYKGETCEDIQRAVKVAKRALQHLANLCKRFVSFTKTFNYSRDVGYIPYDIDRNESRHGIRLNRTWYADSHSETYREVKPVLLEALMNCSTMILKCIWRNKIYPCDSLFSPVDTKFGRCCSFNKVPQAILRGYGKNSFESTQYEREMSEEEWTAWSQWNIDDDLITSRHLFWNKKRLDVPRHQNQPGMHQGLSIVVNPELAEYHCPALDSEGFRVLAHSPIDMPHVSDFGKGLSPGTETFAAIFAEVTMIRKQVKTMSLAKRGCYIKGEFKLKTAKFYTKLNCIDECIANITFKACGCLRYYQPRETGRRICGAELDKCVINELGEINKVGLHRKCEMCYPTCIEIQYYLDTTSLPIRRDVDLWKNKTSGLHEVWANENVSIIHFYFGSNYTESRARRQLYSLHQIVADAGGLLGLAIGFGIINLVEPIYCFTLRFFVKCKETYKSA